MGSRARTVASALAISAALAGCVEVDGGAVELSWSLRSFDGEPVDCGDADVRAVRLCWRAAPGGETLPAICDGAGAIDFDCGDQHGSSRFELASGRTGFLVEPLCADGEPAASGTYQVPAPIVRDVTEGEVVALSSIAIIVSDNHPDDNDKPPICGPSGVCTCQR
jgi:hypothetical protein